MNFSVTVGPNSSSIIPRYNMQIPARLLLEPILFATFTSLLAAIASQFQQQFADDTLLFFFLMLLSHKPAFISSMQVSSRRPSLEP